MSELLTSSCCSNQVGIAPKKQLSHLLSLQSKRPKLAWGAEIIKTSYGVAHVILHGDICIND